MGMTIETIRELLQNNKVRWTTHCVEQMGARDISKADVTYCIENGEIIENYPDDFPYPSCLIYGKCTDGRIIHIVAGSDGEVLYIITSYIPNVIKFEDDLKTRRD